MQLDKILVVDDTDVNREILANLLTEQGYTVHCASGGEQALEFVGSVLPDLILLDIRMPDMDGYEVCLRLKADERTRAIPIMFISILEDERDKVKGFQVGGVDYITKPFQAEEVLARVKCHLQIQELTEHLEQKVKERTDEIRRLNQELELRVRERTAMLEAANKELEGFSYSVSHDLRAPLRHIDGFLQLLKKNAETTIDDQSQYYMDAISDAALKMGRLLDDLLSFAKLGRHLPSFQKVALEALVRDILRELKANIVKREIDWRIGHLPVVKGDETMLRTVMVNLISNALKFTRTREKARIEIGSIPNQTAEAVVFVLDNGVGFDMAYAGKLYGVFQRLHHEEEFEGTGIGLANVRRIITQHGGRTWAEGKPGQGATFYFALPQV